MSFKFFYSHIRRFRGWAVLGLLVTLGSFAFAKYEREAMSLESDLQQRIESILSKTLASNSYIVTVKVEMSEPAGGSTVHSQTNTRQATNPFLTQNKFMLPGVPEKKDFVKAASEETNETTVNAFSTETMVRRISISILVAPDVTNEQIRELRDFISSSIPFNPLRGDEMDIQRSPLLKRAVAPPKESGNASATNANFEGKGDRGRAVFGGLNDRSTLMLVVFLGGIILIFLVLIVFLFGPVRAFLNRLLAVLPRIGEQAAYTVTNAPTKQSVSVASPAGMHPELGMVNRIHRRDGGSGSDQPFHFIREEQLTKLPILLRQMDPSVAAIVLAYLPPEWASRVFSALDIGYQTSLVTELSQPKEVPAEIVKEIEAQVKSKLPYFVGGSEWIQSVYQMTQPQTQRAILGSLNQQSPELAKALRRKTFFFEDLAVLPIGGLRLLLQEAGFPLIALALRDEKPEIRDAVVRRLPPAMREILLQELELSSDDKNGSVEARAKAVALARQMLLEGRISFGEKK